MNGIVCVAYGRQARIAATQIIASLQAHNANLSVSVVSASPLRVADTICFDDPGPGARWAKLNIDRLSPYERTLYLDADTEVLDDVSSLFAILADGWDLVIAPSRRQGADVLGHLPAEDRQYTLEVVGSMPLNLQAGVFGFRKGEAVSRLFEAWRAEWRRFEDQDQGALLRALSRSPIRVWLLGQDWNGGRLIEHHFGRLR